MKSFPSFLNVKRGLLRIWVVLSALFILGVAFYRYCTVRDEFYGASSVHGLTVPDNEYSNENLVPVSCDKAPGQENPSLLSGYGRLSIDSQTGVISDFSKAQPLTHSRATVSTGKSVPPPPPPGLQCLGRGRFPKDGR
jgi:hypothetical protein